MIARAQAGEPQGVIMGLRSLLLLFPLLLTACSGTGGKPTLSTAPFAVGTNAARETCSAGGVPNQIPQMSGGQLVHILCGEWKQPSARIFIGEGLQLATGWQSYLAERFTCQPGQQTQVLGDVPVTLYNCSRLNGGWPHVALSLSIGGMSYFADGVPASVPAIETAIGQLSGRLKRGETVTGAEALRFVQAGSSIGGNVLFRYSDLIRAGRSYMSAERYSEAEQAFAEALRLFREANGVDAPGAIDSLLPMALAISNQGRFPEADQRFAEAELLLKGGGRSATHNVYLAMHLANEGHYPEADQYAKEAQAFYVNARSDGSEKTGIESANLKLNRLGKERDALNISVSRGTAPQNTSVNQLSDDLQTILYLRAELLRRQDERQKLTDARSMLDVGSTLTTSVIDREIRGYISRTRGLTLAQLDETQAAYTELSQAIDVFRAVGQTERPMGVTMLRRGAVLARTRTMDEALAEFRRGAETLRKSNQFTTPDVIEPYLAALYERSAGQSAAAAAIRAEMLDALQLVRDPKTARTIALATARLRSSTREESATLRHMTDLEQEIRRLREERATLPSETVDPVIKARQTEIDALVAKKIEQLADAETAIQATSAGYNILLQTRAKLADIQQQLGPKEAVVAFFVGDSQTFGFMIHPGSLDVWRTKLTDAETIRLTSDIRQSITPDPKTSRMPAFNVDAARSLYQNLFGTDQERLKDLESLVVVASGQLASIPFSLLVAGDPGAPAGGGHRYTLPQLSGLPWLIRSVPVTHVPSLQALAKMRAIPASKASRPYIAFADVVRPSTQQLKAFAGTECGADAQLLDSLSPLPGTRNEVNSVGRIMNAAAEDVVLADRFNLARIGGKEGRPLNDYRIIHFASHALLPSELVCLNQPAIQVSIPKGSVSAIDGLLTLAAVEGLQLDADLVVLSACNTAGPSGDSLGESLTGLANGFFYAGARGMVVTHWPADDSSAHLMMSEMFANLASNRARSTASALQGTQIDMITKAGTSPEWQKIYAHPYFWAVFALVGDGARATSPIASN